MKIATKDVIVTGLGFISSIGNNLEAVSSSLRQLKSGISPYRFFGENDCSEVKVAGVVKGFDFSAPGWAAWSYPEDYSIPKKLLRGLPPHGVYAFCAMEQAIQQAGLTNRELSNPRTGLFCASAGSPKLMYQYLDQLHSTKGRRGSPMGVVSTISGTLNFNLSAHYGIEGASLGFVSACASSSHALGFALDEIRLGRQDAIIVIGAEDFTAESLLPFAAMNALSRATGSDASCPWDKRRDGFVATGGASALILESGAHARRRGATPLARLIGWGQSSDGLDKTASHPEGAGLGRAISNALEDSALTPSDVDYINAHATSTKVGDISEAKAIERVFHTHNHNPPTSGTKAITGHGLSMSGAMEAGICSICLNQGFIPGNAHLREIDPMCSKLNLPLTSRDDTAQTCISNSSGFGGSNVCLAMASL